MQLKPEEAKVYYCCVKEGYCKGDSCMAWKFAYEEIYPNTNFPAPPSKKKTEYGYCGLTE